jgi:hypothetical protein
MILEEENQDPKPFQNQGQSYKEFHACNRWHGLVNFLVYMRSHDGKFALKYHAPNAKRYMQTYQATEPAKFVKFFIESAPHLGSSQF